MTVYLVASVKVADDSWLPDYAANVHHIVHKHGGEYLSRSANITTVEGDAPDASVIGIIRFPSMKAAQGFLDDPGLRSLWQGAPCRQHQPILHH